MSAAEDRFERARAAFEAVHAEDPAGEALGYHAGVAQWIERLVPDAQESLRLAAWCQHLRRWALPRGDFPEGREGYRRWRSALSRQHAEEAAQILAGVGYDEAVVTRVGELLVKKRLQSDPEVGALEDAVCLVFLQQQAERFAAAHPEAKVVAILQKTWAKMTDAGRAAAHGILPQLPPAVQALVIRAIAST